MHVVRKSGALVPRNRVTTLTLAKLHFSRHAFRVRKDNHVNISLRVDDDIRSRLDKIAEQLDRPRAWVALEGIKQFIEYHEWFAQSVEKAVATADAGGPFLAHDDVVARASERRRERKK